MENVKALTKKKFASDFKRWREWLIKQGYTNYYCVLNAKDYGVPQNRERVFMASFLGEHTTYSFPKSFPLERRLKHVLESDVADKYWLIPKQISSIIQHNERKQAEGCGFKTNFQNEDGIASSILTMYGGRPGDTYIKIPTYGNSLLNEMIRAGKIDPTKTLWIDAYNQTVSEDIVGTITTRINASSHYMVSDPRIITMGNYSESGHEASRVVSIEGIAPTVKENHGTVTAIATPRVIQIGNLIENAAWKNPHRGRVYSVEGIAPCLNCADGGQREVKILQRGHGYNKGGVYNLAPALTTSRWQDNNFAVIEYWIRKLTPRECFRLMDVPERYIDSLVSSGISDSQLYKLAGNSIVVSCLYHIFYKMFIDTKHEYGAPECHSRELPVYQQLSLF